MADRLLASLVAALLAASALSAAAAATPGLPGLQHEWAVIAPKPDSNPGFLFIPDYSEAGPVFQRAPTSCGPTVVTCTARVFPEKPEIWYDQTTADLYGNSELAAFSAFFFVEEDADRLLPTPVEFEGWSKAVNASLGSVKLLQSNELDVVLSHLAYPDQAARTLHIAIRLEGNRLHRTICLAPDDERSTQAVVGFATSH